MSYIPVIYNKVYWGVRVEFRSGDETDLDLFEVFDLMVSTMFFVIFTFFGGGNDHIWSDMYVFYLGWKHHIVTKCMFCYSYILNMVTLVG